MNKSRINKDLVRIFQNIIEYKTENILVIEILNLTKKLLKKSY